MVLARLKPGIDIKQAQAEMSTISIAWRGNILQTTKTGAPWWCRCVKTLWAMYGRRCWCCLERWLLCC